jgi:hypothetical protein
MTDFEVIEMKTYSGDDDWYPVIILKSVDEDEKQIISTYIIAKQVVSWFEIEVKEDD